MQRKIKKFAPHNSSSLLVATRLTVVRHRLFGANFASPADHAARRAATMEEEDRQDAEEDEVVLAF